MVLMSLIDIFILVVVLVIVGLLTFNLFIKKNRSHCSGCAMMTKAKKRNKKMKKIINIGKSA